MLLLLTCVLISHPVAEVGISDEWSYVRSAQLMAQTGRFMYVGWASAMLGWMLPVGAMFAKLLGFSFTAVRMTNVVTGCATAYLLQRCFVRAGLNTWNATITTLTFVLTPLYLPLATTFMTDLPGMLFTLVCVYCCLRALGTEQDRTAVLWLIAGSLLAAIGGTARQTVWLALFFMIPSAAWLLRKRKLNWLLLLLVWLVSVAFTWGSLAWFSHQPYSLREATVAGYVDRDLLYNLIEHVTRAVLAALLMLLPITLAYVAKTRTRWKQAPFWYAGCLVVTALFLAFAAHRHTLVTWLAPFDITFFTEKGLSDNTEIGTRGTVLAPWVRALLTGLVWLCSVLTAAYFFALRKVRSQPDAGKSTFTARGQILAVLFVPYVVTYSLLMAHRAIFSVIFDRYLLGVVFVPALFLVLWYQEAIAPRLPTASVMALVIFGVFTTAANHDLFAMERARVLAADELIQAGIPRTEFYGGFEYDGWTQVERYGFANSPYINLPQGFSADRPILLRMKEKPCNYWAARMAPAIQPRYAISFDTTSCGGPAPFAPVEYKSWLPPYGSKIYIQRVLERAY